jgi:hypothetical protein
MKSRKVGVNKHKKHNATKRKLASKIKKTRRLKKNHKHSRHSRSKKGGGQDNIYYLFISTHGGYECDMHDESTVWEDTLEGNNENMNIRKINATKFGIENIFGEKEAEELVSVVQNMARETKDTNTSNIDTVAGDLSGLLYNTDFNKEKGTDWKNKHTETLEKRKKDLKEHKKDVRSMLDIFDESELLNAKNTEEEIQDQYDAFNNYVIASDRAYEIETINRENPQYIEKGFHLKDSDDSDEKNEYDQSVYLIYNSSRGRVISKNITNSIINTYGYGKGGIKLIKLSQIIEYLSDNNMYDVIIVDISCSSIRGFSDRYKRTYDRSLKRSRRKY